MADPREIELANYAEVYLPLKPGTNITLLNAMMNVIINEGLQDEEYIKERTENYEEMKKIVMEYTQKKLEKYAEVDPERY